MHISCGNIENVSPGVLEPFQEIWREFIQETGDVDFRRISSFLLLCADILRWIDSKERSSDVKHLYEVKVFLMRPCFAF